MSREGYISGNSSLLSGTLTATVTAAKISEASARCYEVMLQNDPDSPVSVFVGNGARQDWEIVPGGSVTLPVANINMAYVKTASGTATVNYLARA